jgi:hypothetical protein
MKRAQLYRVLAVAVGLVTVGLLGVGPMGKV